MITATARDSNAEITVTVGPGGGLVDLTLTPRSMRLGGRRLAAAILALVNQATAAATLRATRKSGLDDAHLDALGIGLDAELAEQASSTTPETWRL
ncbi:YbaB/EbfC family DNA-binding protein [Actinocrispum sp. NPDC049592]|uniref:YbaB/EbfC family DNA-binding protein n=1 Tax=Actinocrispum sp. NPDC049592 TaxID=3154835 RepID=UPI003419B193